MKKCLLFSLFIYPLMGFSQIEECGFDYLTKQLFETDSTIRNIILNNDFNTNNEQAGQHIAEDSVVEIIFTIPVVVHVIHLGESIGIGTNISDDQIYGAITGLNERFSNFCLLYTSPSPRDRTRYRMPSSA